MMMMIGLSGNRDRTHLGHSVDTTTDDGTKGRVSVVESLVVLLLLSELLRPKIRFQFVFKRALGGSMQEPAPNYS